MHHGDAGPAAVAAVAALLPFVGDDASATRRDTRDGIFSPSSLLANVGDEASPRGSRGERRGFHILDEVDSVLGRNTICDHDRHPVRDDMVHLRGGGLIGKSATVETTYRNLKERRRCLLHFITAQVLLS